MTNQDFRVSIDDDSPDPAPAQNDAGRQDQSAERQPVTTGRPAPRPTGAEGTKFTRFEDPEAEKRFKRIYGNMKAYERELGTSRSQIAALAQQNEALYAAVTRLVNGVQNTNLRSQAASLKSDYKNALVAGDYDKASDLMGQMADISAQSKMIEERAKPDPQAQRRQPVTTTQSARPAELTRAEYGTVQNWRAEKYDDGTPVRPWAAEGHPQFNRAVNLLQVVAREDEFAQAPIEDILDEVDRLMGVEVGSETRGRDEATGEDDRRDAQGRFRPATVLDGVGARNRPRSKNDPSRGSSLNADQKRVAERMFLNTPLANNPEEAHERYAKQLAVTENPNAPKRVVMED